MSVVLVTGGTGTFGRKLVPILAARGHEVRTLSRRPGWGTHVGDLSTGSGLAQAAAGAEVVVHAATDSRTTAIRYADPAQTRRLLAAIGDCHHLVYISIVGIDAIRYRYYRSKLECERLIAASPVPSTTLRATQFHELIARVLTAAARSPVAMLPLDLRFQSVAAVEVAGRVADLVESEPVGRAPDLGGPQVLTGRQITQAWLKRHNWPRIVFGVRWPGSLYRGFATGLHTCPEHADGRQTWEEFLAA